MSRISGFLGLWFGTDKWLKMMVIFTLEQTAMTGIYTHLDSTIVCVVPHMPINMGCFANTQTTCYNSWQYKANQCIWVTNLGSTPATVSIQRQQIGNCSFKWAPDWKSSQYMFYKNAEVAQPEQQKENLKAHSNYQPYHLLSLSL